MWLLDANMDVHLVDLLSHFGVNSDTAANRGWKALSNGQLVAAAVTAATALAGVSRTFSARLAGLANSASGGRRHSVAKSGAFERLVLRSRLPDWERTDARIDD